MYCQAEYELSRGGSARNKLNMETEYVFFSGTGTNDDIYQNYHLILLYVVLVDACILYPSTRAHIRE